MYMYIHPPGIYKFVVKMFFTITFLLKTGIYNYMVHIINYMVETSFSRTLYQRLCFIIIFRMMKEFVQQNQDGQVKKVLKILGEDFAGSSNPNTRKGGLIGLAAAAIALGKVTCFHCLVRCD